VQLISAVVRPEKVYDICGALERFGFRGLTLTHVSGAGKEPSHLEVYRATQYTVALRDEAKIEIVAADGDVSDLVGVICKVAGTGRPGDGKVWVVPVLHLERIRTGERHHDAL
jgi:nitrogen regulatory protein P-II 1